MNAKLSLFNPQQAHAALSAMWPTIKSYLLAGHRCTLEVRPETRSDSQNKLLHAILTEIAATHEWAGSRRDVEVWKRLMVAAWKRARGDQIEILPALDGHGVDIVFSRTSKMTKAEVNELIEFIEAWRAQQ